MSIVLKYDKKKYIPKETIRIQRKYHVKAIYLPKGQGIDDLFRFFTQNKDNIKSITDTVGNVSNAVSSIANTTLNTVKGIRDIRAAHEANIHQKALSDKALENIVADTSDHRVGIKPKRGGYFYFES